MFCYKIEKKALIWKKCYYCNKRIDLTNNQTDCNIKNYCNDDCKNKATIYTNYMKRWLPIFGISVCLCILTCLIQFFFFTEIKIISNISYILLGLLIIVFPFGNTLNELGVRKTKIIVRILGCIIIVTGIIFALVYIN